MLLADVNDVNHCVRRCYIVLTLELQIHVNVCETVQLLLEFFSAMAEIWKKLKISNVFSSFIVC